MKLTVKDIMKLGPLAQGKVIAGQKGLSNAVESVSVLEVPKATVFVQEKQIEISAFYAIADNIESQLDVVRGLKKCNASGLILCHVGLILESVPRQLMDLCNELDFPLILVPPQIAYIDIISPILDSLLQLQNKKLEHAMKIYDKMTNLMIEKKDFDDITAALSKLINRSVYFYNHSNVCVSPSHNNLSVEYDIYIRQNIQDYFNSFIEDKNDVYISTMDGGDKILLAPIASSMMYYGVMVVFDASTLGDLDFISILQTKNALGIVSLNKINLKDYNILLKRDYINDLIEWNFKDEQAAIQRGSSLGLDMSRIKIAMIIGVFNFTEVCAEYSESQLQKLKTDFNNAVQNELSYFAPDSITFNASDKILILFSFEKYGESVRQRLLNIGGQLRKTVAQVMGLSASVGIGGYYSSISKIRNSYQEALSALKISDSIFGRPRCTFFDEVQIYSLIRDSIDVQRAKAAMDSMVLPIRQYDKENNTQLLLTFKMLILTDMDTEEVSEKLFLHKNTVLQRKKKISKLFKFDPFAMPYRLQFQIAAMIDEF